MAKHVVASVAELPPGASKVVEVGGRSIGIFNVGGELFALRNRCPHQGGPLCLGRRFGALSADAPGVYRYERAGEFIRCPWHGWEFDIRTGQSWFDPQRTRVRSYDVEVRDAAELPRDENGRIRGPYVADTYPVTVEEELVVVDLGRA